jgi:hypothetical protein
LKTFAICLAFGVAGPAQAGDFITFQSPTGNIHCLMDAEGAYAYVRCDLRELVPSYTRAPADCDLDWGSSFAVEDQGKGYLACVGDTVQDRRNPVLPYGEAMSWGGISCVSAKTGVTCTNADGHGFSVAKAKQKLF